MQFLGVVEGKGLYARWNEKNNQIMYNLDGQEIAAYDFDVMTMKDPIVFRENTLANELSAEAKDKIQILARTIDRGEIQEKEKNIDKYRKEISNVLEKKEEELISLTEIELDEKIEKKKIEEPEEDKEATRKNIRVKQELSLGAMATDIKTIGQVLQKGGKIPNIEGKNFNKLLVVESNEVKNIDKNAKINTSRFSFVLEATDGTVVPLDLEQDRQEGNNPREISYRTNADGRVEQDDVNSRYKIGDGDATLSIKFSNGPGNIEVAYSAHKTIGEDGIEGNVSMDHQLQTSTVYWESRTDSRDREIADGYRGVEDKANEAELEARHNETMKRGQKGFVDPNDNKTYKNDDGDMKTKDDNHQNSLIERARKLMSEDEEVADTFTEDEVVKMLEKAHDDGQDLDEKEEEIKQDASNIRKR